MALLVSPQGSRVRFTQAGSGRSHACSRHKAVRWGKVLDADLDMARVRAFTSSLFM